MKPKRKSQPSRGEGPLFGLPAEEASPWRVFRIMTEFVSGFDLLKKYDLAVSVFGSTRVKPQHRYYQEAEQLAERLAKAGFAIITGGGPGVMEAANKGSYQVGGQSVGLNIQLPDAQRKNKYVKESESFHYFFVRKVMLAFASEIYIFFPGGFGTLDEFSELITLVQTKKINPIPIILIGRDYWQPLLDWFEKTLYQKYQAIDRNDMKLYYLVDDGNEAWKLVQKLTKSHKLQRSDIQ